jgi:hypothetical protein
MRVNINTLIKSSGTHPDSYRDDPAAETKSIGLQADLPAGRQVRELSWFLQRNLDNFIMT